MVFFEMKKGATPIEDIADLMPTHILNQKELNEWEAANILQALQKNLIKRRNLVLSVELLKNIHREMFNATWKWAGLFRKKNLNIGIDWVLIPEQIKLLVDDMNYWKEKGNMATLEQSIRLHHRLVKIHPFVNGNGRHARLVSDIFLFNNNHKLPDWPNAQLIEKNDIRMKYIEALRSADVGNYEELETFTRKLLDG